LVFHSLSATPLVDRACDANARALTSNGVAVAFLRWGNSRFLFLGAAFRLRLDQQKRGQK
jgi:hypothetical protein